MYYYYILLYIMYYLVQYTEDNLYYVCKRARISKRYGQQALVRYSNGYKYPANIICSNGSKKTLSMMKHFLTNNTLQVGLVRMEFMDLESNENIPNNLNDISNDDNDSGTDPNYECTDKENKSCESDTVPDPNTIKINPDLEEALKHNIIVLENVLLNPPEAGKKTKLPQRRHCCFYCHKMLFKIYRHYISVHKNESAVREIIALPEKTLHRKKLLDKLRKKGDYIFNTQLKCQEQKPVVCRQTLKEHKTIREKDVPCPSCLGYYSKLSIRHHLEKCMPVHEQGKRRGNIQAECRRYENNIHPCASDILKNKIFPVLNEDEVTNAIRYDEAVITYANYLCRKYTTPHHATQIRSNMRALGRLILAVKKLNPGINNLYDILDVGYVDLIIQGIDIVAGLDKNCNMYKAPATALLLATELKKLCKLLLMEFIKKKDTESQKRMEDLQSVFNLEFNVTVNKKGLETQKINNRRKKVTLPKTDHVAQFRTYLEKKIEYFINKLENTFNIEHWMHLAEYTLVHLAVFNRKRPGETQRILIDDYKHLEIIEDGEEDPNYDSVSREQIKKWARIKFTGKLGNDTALLIHRRLGFKAINLILKFREKAGVNMENRYVFGYPSQFQTQSTFQACQLIRKFASESGIENSQLLRTRLLRQHLATETATSNVDDRLEGRISEFMSHKRKIHEDYYVKTQKNDDIIKVSKLLETFSTSKEQSRPNVGTSTSSSSCDNYKSSSEAEYSSDDLEEHLSKAEINYALGKNTRRHSWNAIEKKTAKDYFHDEIHKGKPIEKSNVKQFFETHKDIYKDRTPHLIMQWIKYYQKKVIQEREGIQAKRLRWTTPEKEILTSTTERHSAEGTIPSMSECELLYEKHDVLKKRNPQSIKSFIYGEIKKKII